MSPRSKKQKPLHERTLSQLISLVVTHKFPFEDLVEMIEDRAYEVCQESDPSGEKAVRQLRRLASFYEAPKDGVETDGKFADVSALIGELYLYHDQTAKSIRWFKKAIGARDDHPQTYHSLAQAQVRTGDAKGAIRSLEEELLLAPGNLYSYLLLADLYAQREDYANFEETLHRLLVRDPDNIQALHRLVKHYEKHQPDSDVELLRRRLISIRRDLSKLELTIWTYHMCREGQLAEALGMLQDLVGRSPDSPTVHLLTAEVLGQMRQYTKKKRALAVFKQLVSVNAAALSAELRLFSQIFGRKAVSKLGKRLAISTPAAS